jgi:hypothetical protein
MVAKIEEYVSFFDHGIRLIIDNLSKTKEWVILALVVILLIGSSVVIVAIAFANSALSAFLKRPLLSNKDVVYEHNSYFK